MKKIPFTEEVEPGVIEVGFMARYTLGVLHKRPDESPAMFRQRAELRARHITDTTEVSEN